MDDRVACIIVTYNRLSLLKETVDAVRNQSLPVENIIVVDNNSSDGTAEYLRSLEDSRLSVVHLDKNLGGAGGFYEGIKNAYLKSQASYFWLMDDDTIPEKDCLEELIKGGKRINGQFGFLASHPIWIDGSPNLMNIPKPMPKWSIDVDKDLIRIRCATFVSVLINRESVEEVGLPYKQFFIWSDDIEYTMRISYTRPCYFVGTSRVVHKTKNNVGSDIVTDSADRIGRYFFAYRNYYYTQKKFRGFVGASIQIIKLFVMTFCIIRKSKDHKFKRIVTIFKGLISGLVFHPKVDYLKTENK